MGNIPIDAKRTLHSPDITCTLNVTIKGIENQKGNLLLAVYDNDQDLADNTVEKAVYKIKMSAKKTIQQTEFQLKEGVYAVLVAHDLNSNNKVDKSWMGIPTEPIGVSNGFKSKRRKPTFAECSFTLRQHRQQVEIILERF